MQHPFHCPHCLSEKMAFNFINFIKKDEIIVSRPYRHTAYSFYTTFWACANCHKGLCVTVETPGSETPGKKDGSSDYNFTILETYPEIKESQAPEHTPENIANIYIQGLNSFKREEFDTASMGMRKALETTVKSLITDPKAKTLFLKIEALKNNDLIPKSMVDWAHQVREIGNDGAHDIVDEKDAYDIVFFTEMFLTYIYTLPTKITKRRKSVSESTE